MKREEITHAKRIVIKIGTRVITENDNTLDRKIIEKISCEVSKSHSDLRDFIIVSSGAIALGLSRLGLDKRPEKIILLQAAASLGQSKLMHIYENEFGKNNIPIAQILLTYEDIQHRHRYLNVRNTIFSLWDYRAIPIVNENDAVSFAEIRFGDNDMLAAHLSNMMDADLLIILTDIDGLYNKNPILYSDAERLSVVNGITEDVKAMAMGKGSNFSSGGMASKLKAAEIATKSGVGVVITHGKYFNLKSILSGEDIGTYFTPIKKRLKGKKKWIAFNPKVSGKIIVDEGGVKAIVDEKKSLLPVGIKDVVGDFKIGDNVAVLDEDGNEIARGLTNFSSDEIKKIMGKKTSLIPKILNSDTYFDEVIHRDNLVIKV